MFIEIENHLAIAKEEALSNVVAEFFTTITKQGYTLTEFLEAVADVVNKQHGYESALLVENAIVEIKRCS